MDGAPEAVQDADRDSNRQERLEGALRENAELFQGVFNQAAVGMALTGPDRNVVQANRKLCDFLGYEFEELFGTTLRAVTHPDFVSQVDEQIRKLVDGVVESATLENLYVRKDGTTVWGEWTSSLIRNELGAPKYFISVIQNIDDRKKAEAEARETAELLENSQRIAHLGSWHLDIVEDKERWSDEVYRIFGLEPQSIDFTGYGFLDYVHPEDREKARAAQDYAIDQHQPYSVEYRLVRPDGTERTVYEYAELEFDDQGAPIRLSGTIQDVTELRKTEKTLRESEEFFRVIFTQAATGIAQLSPDGRFIKVNQKLSEILGFPQDELQSLHFWEVTHPDDLERHRRQFRRLTLGEISDYSTEMRYVRADSTLSWGNVTLSVVRDEADKPLYAILVATDIDDRKRAEIALQYSNERLEEAQRIARLGSWEWDPDTDIEWWSDELYRIMGFQPGSITPNDFDYRHYVHPDDVSRLKEVEESSFRDNTPYSVEYRIIRPDGVERLISESGEVEFDAGGKPRWRGVGQDITERKQAELVLRRTTEQLKEAQRLAHVGHWDWDPESNVSEWSEETFRIFGLNTGDETPTHQAFMQRFLHEADRCGLERLMEEALRTGNPYKTEFRIVRPDGEVRTVMESCELYVSEQTGRPRLRGVLQDITRLKLIEHELRKSEQRLAAFFTTAPAGLVLYDREGRYVRVNETIARLNGLPPQAHIGKRPSDILPPALGRRIEEANQKVLETGDQMLDVEISAPVPTDPAETGQYIFSRFPIPGPEGERLGIGAVVVDITGRKRAEEELRIREQELSQAQRIGGIGHWRLDFDSRTFSYWSDELYRIFGVDKDHFEPTLDNYLASIHKDDLQASIENREAAFAERRPYQYEHRIVRPSGEIRVIWGEVRPEFDSNGKPTVLFGITQDVTEVRQREAELRQAQKMEVVGQLTGGIAHDFNNLLGVMIGNLELAQETVEPGSETTCLLDNVIHAADRGAALTQRLLAFSRKQPLRPELVNARKMVDDTLELLQRTLGETVEIEITSSENLWPCFADPAQLESAIVNLAVNARDAMPDGGKLTIETCNAQVDQHYAASQTEVDPGDYVLIAISDTGFGMSADVLKHVFEPFFTTKDVGDGSGLGLSMVYGFVKQSGGHIAISSEVGEGTTIKVYLPRAFGALQEVSEAVHDAEAVAAHNEVVLVVEDDCELRALVVSILQSLNYEVLESEASKGALDVLDGTDQVDLLLTDVVLPGNMSGQELAVVARTRKPDLRVLFMSGYTEDALIHEGRLEAGVHLLQKPFRKMDVAQAVRRILDIPPA